MVMSAAGTLTGETRLSVDTIARRLRREVDHQQPLSLCRRPPAERGRAGACDVAPFRPANVPDGHIASPDSLASWLACSCVICAITFPAAGLYKRKWKYASIADYIVLVEATLIASLLLMTFIFLYSHFAIIPHSIIAIEIMALVSLLAGFRLTFRQDDLKALVAALRLRAGGSQPAHTGAAHRRRPRSRPLFARPAA